MKNVLVTGANGQLGNEIRVMASEKENYFFTDVAELDITDIKAIDAFMEGHSIKTVINCAAYTNVDRAEDDYATADLLNNKAVKNLAECCKKHEAYLIHVSTDYVFDGNGCVPYIEDNATAPTGVYGVTKLAGEKSVLETGCGYVIIRTAWLYSEYGNNFVKTMRRLTSEKNTLNVVFDQVGTPTYAGDLAAAIYKIVESGAYKRNDGIYHFSNEGVCSWYDFAVAICSAFGNKCELHPCHSSEFPSKVRRPSFSVLDKTKIKATFGVEVPYWMDSLQKCVANLKKA